ncbi:MAG: peptidylprolyl isomerase [Spirochaetota bacterium]|nr:MAG: peptidylprolyl isomerase [Spirochaetota bacterium]
MPGVKFGDTVKVHYTGKLDNGDVFDNTDDKGPLTFLLGDGKVIPGFEQALVGMNPGEKKTVKISALRAYGPYLKQLVIEVGKDKFVDNIEPEIGQRLQINQPDGEKFIVTVTEVSESNVILDANHPLAGKDLTFDIHLLEIMEK